MRVIASSNGEIGDSNWKPREGASIMADSAIKEPGAGLLKTLVREGQKGSTINGPNIAVNWPLNGKFETLNREMEIEFRI